MQTGPFSPFSFTPTTASLSPAQSNQPTAPGSMASDTAIQTGLNAAGITFADGETTLTQDQWVDMMRTSPNPDARNDYEMLVRLAGGRTDNEAIKQVLNRFYALSQNGDAASALASEKGWVDQITNALNRYDPTNILIEAARPAVADALRNSSAGQTEWGGHLQRILDTPGAAVAFRDGVRVGAVEGAKDMVVGVVEMAAKGARLQADKSLFGILGDGARAVVGGKLPGPLEQVMPSYARGAATDQAIRDTGAKIGAYIKDRASDPSKIGADVSAVISRQWASLKADHAAAARQGPQAEAKWWGEIVGRATFEAAVTFVPVAGQVKRAENVADAAKAVEKVGDGIPSGGKLDDIAGGGVVAATRIITGGKGANTVSWTVDGQGRLLSARASLSEVFSNLVRGVDEKAAQRATASKGIEGDHGGHAVGHRFLGDQGEINMFPQNGVPEGVKKNFNGSAMLTLENELADWVKAGGKIDFEIKFSNFDKAHPNRPNMVEVYYKVYDKETGNLVFENGDRFRNQAGVTFDRVSKSTINSMMVEARR